MNRIYSYNRSAVMSYPETLGWCMDIEVRKLEDKLKRYGEAVELIKLFQKYAECSDDRFASYSDTIYIECSEFLERMSNE